MYYISDYRKKAIDKIIPYLIEFPQVVQIIEQSADRYQAIEDIIWRIADNFKIDNARGVFLQALAHNEDTVITYTDRANDAFTYGTDKPLFQAYGAGHYYSQYAYNSGAKKDVSDEKTIRAVKAKIIQNNTNATIEDLIESLKLYFNSTNVRIFESDPLNVSIMLSGKNLEVSTSGNHEVIKKMLPVCVALKKLYIDTYRFDIFQYDENSSYGDNRYPVLVGDTVDVYTYISQSVSLDSEFHEYVKTNYNSFDNNMYTCIVGEFTKINNGSTLWSSTNEIENISLEIGENNNIIINYNDTIYSTNVIAELNKRYTIILSNKDNTFKTWIHPSISIKGENLEQDISYLLNQINYANANVIIENYNTIEAPIFINCKNNQNTQENFGDFVYYAIIFGDSTNNDFEPNEYYVSCFGEKQILFNCFKNENHLPIYTLNPLISNIMARQHYYNYKAFHSNGKYLYMDGKSGIDYYINNTPQECTIKNLDIQFDVCMPIEISTGNIITDFVSSQESGSKIYFDKEGKIYIDIPNFIEKDAIDENNNITIIEEEKITTFISKESVISIGEYANFKLEINQSIITLYKNGKQIDEFNLNGNIKNLPTIFRIAYDKDVTQPYKGFLKNVNVNIIGLDINNTQIDFNINLPFKSRLKDSENKFEYINYGARFITTPQLISDNSNLDIYGNQLVSKR